MSKQNILDGIKVQTKIEFKQFEKVLQLVIFDNFENVSARGTCNLHVRSFGNLINLILDVSRSPLKLRK